MILDVHRHHKKISIVTDAGEKVARRAAQLANPGKDIFISLILDYGRPGIHYSFHVAQH